MVVIHQLLLRKPYTKSSIRVDMMMASLAITVEAITPGKERYIIITK
jgi:hypothetical protein